MRKFLLSSTAAIAISASAAFAQSYTDQIVAALQAENYESIEITTGPTQIKVEAIRDGRKLEAIYDAETGVLLKQEVESVDDDDEFVPGVSYDTDDEDFYDDEDDDEDDEIDDDEDDDEDDDDDENDDDEDDDDESDDDESDDE